VWAKTIPKGQDPPYTTPRINKFGSSERYLYHDLIDKSKEQDERMLNQRIEAS